MKEADDYDQGYSDAIEDFIFRLEDLEQKYDGLCALVAARDRVYKNLNEQEAPSN